MTWDKTVAQAATCRKCELTKSAVGCIRFLVHSSVLQHAMDFEPQPTLVLIYRPEKMNGLVGSSKWEGTTYSRFLRAINVAPPVFKPVNY